MERYIKEGTVKHVRSWSGNTVVFKPKFLKVIKLYKYLKECTCINNDEKDLILMRNHIYELIAEQIKSCSGNFTYHYIYIEDIQTIGDNKSIQYTSGRREDAIISSVTYFMLIINILESNVSIEERNTIKQDVLNILDIDETQEKKQYDNCERKCTQLINKDSVKNAIKNFSLEARNFNEKPFIHDPKVFLTHEIAKLQPTVTVRQLLEEIDKYKSTSKFTTFFNTTCAGPELQAMKDLCNNKNDDDTIKRDQLVVAVKDVKKKYGAKEWRAGFLEFLVKPDLHKDDKTSTSDVIKKIGKLLNNNLSERQDDLRTSCLSSRNAPKVQLVI